MPNGVCLTHDGKHLLVASTWDCSILIFDLADMSAGPRIFLRGLPGYPDNINRGSNGSYWIAILGMRTKTFDLAMRKPAFRRRMARQIASDEWLFPNINRGCVLHVSAEGAILDVLWDQEGANHPSITSTCEHKGYLYLGGVSNNRIGRVKLAGSDPNWTAQADYWGVS